MATVYRAHEGDLDRCVALKVRPPEFLHDTGFAERSQREARILARLEHPHVVPIPWRARHVDTGSIYFEAR
jgi:serine/threonine-protein kinase